MQKIMAVMAIPMMLIASPATADGGDFLAGVITGVIGTGIVNEIGKKGKSKTRVLPRKSGAAGDNQRMRAQNRRMQSALAEMGFQLGAIDGLIGKQTRWAIREFQGTIGHTQTGILTHAELLALEDLAAEGSNGRRNVGHTPIGTLSNAAEPERPPETKPVQALQGSTVAIEDYLSQLGGRNPLTSESCGAECLPIPLMFTDGNLLVYNAGRTFINAQILISTGPKVILNQTGIFLKGGHGNQEFRITRGKVGDQMEVCMSGQLEGMSDYLVWSARFEIVAGNTIGITVVHPEQRSPFNYIISSSANACFF